MPFGLLKYGLNSEYPGEHHFNPTTELKKHYDVVIIGAGGHGTGIAYHLAKYHGITNVAVLEKNYLGSGNTARNTAVIRSNYLTEEGVTFYRESVKLWQDLSNEFNYNVMMESRGQLTLAHSDAAIVFLLWADSGMQMAPQRVTMRWPGAMPKAPVSAVSNCTSSPKCRI
jgi:sarcosine oxidase subunit beta